MDGRALGRAGMVRDGLRFLVAGLLNTGLTIALYQVLLFWLPPQAAYALSWLAGIAFVAIVYPSRVFVGGRNSTTARLSIVALYVGLFLLGLSLLGGLDAAGVPPRLAIFLVTGVTTTAGFLGSRLLLRTGRRPGR